ncbi:hypothetical protein [Flavobacterium sp.]|jgi:hypothetical protein|uniref:hypothetical protein n=1 Tax=Flavobacterium sp. TaxID=239 RepID=UPI0037BF06EA
MKTQKWTPSHFPKGTVVKTSLFSFNDSGKVVMRHFENTDPAVMTVDHVRVTDASIGRNCLIVTTTPNAVPLYEGDDFVTFHVDHVTEIVSVGKQPDVRYPDKTPVYGYVYDEFNRSVYHKWTCRSLLLSYLEKLQPHNCFNIDEMFTAGVKVNIFKPFEKSEDRYGFSRDKWFKINKRKFKKWVRRNINRFILSQSELQSIANSRYTDDYYKDF